MGAAARSRERDWITFDEGSLRGNAHSSEWKRRILLPLFILACGVTKKARLESHSAPRSAAAAAPVISAARAGGRPMMAVQACGRWGAQGSGGNYAEFSRHIAMDLGQVANMEKYRG
jgi:hypothetical protein